MHSTLNIIKRQLTISNFYSGSSCLHKCLTDSINVESLSISVGGHVWLVSSSKFIASLCLLCSFRKWDTHAKVIQYLLVFFTGGSSVNNSYFHSSVCVLKSLRYLVYGKWGFQTVTFRRAEKAWKNHVY